VKRKKAAGVLNRVFQGPSANHGRWGQGMNRRFTGKAGGIIGVCALIVLLPFFVSGYWVRLFTHIFMYAALAESTNILMGFTGYVPFGNVVFFGMGAYSVAILMGHGVPFFAALGIGAVVCFLFTLAIGHPILKMKGHYFAIATMGVSEAVKQIVTNLDITGGGSGLNVLPLQLPTVEQVYLFFYFLMFLILVATVLVTSFILHSRMGYALRSIKANEDGAKSIGINAPLFKMLAWAISAFFTGLAGGVYAYWMTYIDPPSVFDIVIAVKFIIMILVGGAGTIWGPLIGAFFIEFISEMVWSKFLIFHLTILGSIIVFVIIFMPKGLIWFYRKRFTLSALLENVREGKV
jgi:branched-chain amino acid transport system permease protein